MTTTTIGLRENKREVPVVPPKKRGTPLFLFVTCLVILVVLAGVCVKQNTSINSLALSTTELSDLQKDDTAQLASYKTQLASYIDENNQLKQQLAEAQQYADNWKSYASNVTAQLTTMSEKQVQTPALAMTKTITVNNQWREFESLDVLTKWATANLVTLLSVGDKVADCDDYATRLQLKAFKDGYIMSVQLINDGLLNGRQVSSFPGAHMGNLAMVGNDIYFVEPQPQHFDIVYVCHRD
jgi:hypothetical protein